MQAKLAAPVLEGCLVLLVSMQKISLRWFISQDNEWTLTCPGAGSLFFHPQHAETGLAPAHCLWPWGHSYTSPFLSVCE